MIQQCNTASEDCNVDYGNIHSCNKPDLTQVSKDISKMSGVDIELCGNNDTASSVCSLKNIGTRSTTVSMDSSDSSVASTNRRDENDSLSTALSTADLGEHDSFENYEEFKESVSEIAGQRLYLQALDRCRRLAVLSITNPNRDGRRGTVHTDMDDDAIFTGTNRYNIGARSSDSMTSIYDKPMRQRLGSAPTITSNGPYDMASVSSTPRASSPYTTVSMRSPSKQAMRQRLGSAPTITSNGSNDMTSVRCTSRFSSPYGRVSIKSPYKKTVRQRKGGAPIIRASPPCAIVSVTYRNNKAMRQRLGSAPTINSYGSNDVVSVRSRYTSRASSPYTTFERKSKAEIGRSELMETKDVKLNSDNDNTIACGNASTSKITINGKSLGLIRNNHDDLHPRSSLGTRGLNLTPCCTRKLPKVRTTQRYSSPFDRLYDKSKHKQEAGRKRREDIIKTSKKANEIWTPSKEKISVTQATRLYYVRMWKLHEKEKLRIEALGFMEI